MQKASSRYAADMPPGQGEGPSQQGEAAHCWSGEAGDATLRKRQALAPLS